MGRFVRIAPYRILWHSVAFRKIQTYQELTIISYHTFEKGTVTGLMKKLWEKSSLECRLATLSF